MKSPEYESRYWGLVCLSYSKLMYSSKIMKIILNESNSTEELLNFETCIIQSQVDNFLYKWMYVICNVQVV